MDADLTLFEGLLVWGASDCCMVVSDCLVAMGLPDPMAPYRGRYDSQRGAYRLFRDGGGVEAVIAERMAACGYVEDHPDAIVGLVDTAYGPTACVRAGSFWLAKSEDGAQGYDARHVYRRWGHPCHRLSR